MFIFFLKSKAILVEVYALSETLYDLGYYHKGKQTENMENH